MKKIFYTILILIFLPSLVSAEPSVSRFSGRFLGGDMIMLTGVGFGEHLDFNVGTDNFLNVVWTNFENGELNGGNLFLQKEYQPVNWLVTSLGNRFGSNYNAKQEMVSQRLGTLSHYQQMQAEEWYVTFWFRTTHPDSSGKIWRIYADSPGNNIYLATGGDNTMIRGYSECSSCSPQPITQWDSPDSFVIGQWHRVEILIKRQPDEFRVYLDGMEQWHRISSMGDDQYVYPNFNGNGHTIDFGNMIDNNSGFWNFDDIYADYTRARVELCKGNSWQSKNECEIQIPISWSDSNLTISANQGAFQSGQTVYLYVVDANGEVNPNGYPVTIGGGGDTLPGSPSNLTVR